MSFMVNDLPAPFENSLSILLRKGKLPHAIVLSSSSEEVGISVVTRLVECILCRNRPTQGLIGCGSCDECKIINSNNHPDFIRVNCREKDEASAEFIRGLLSRLSLKSYRGGARVVMLISAEDLGISAANILLKSLEEPAVNTYFILISKNASRLLPTVLSRCQRWFIPAPEQEYLAENDHWDLSRLVHGSLNGDRECQISLSTLIHKEKEDSENILQTIRALLRTELLRKDSNSPKRHSMAQTLLNFLEAEYFIQERNSNAQYILNYVFTLDTPELLREFLV